MGGSEVPSSSCVKQSTNPGPKHAASHSATPKCQQHRCQHVSARNVASRISNIQRSDRATQRHCTYDFLQPLVSWSSRHITWHNDSQGKYQRTWNGLYRSHRSAVRIESNSFSTFLPLYKQLHQLTSVGSIMSSIRLDVTNCLSTSGMCMKKGSAWNFVRTHKTGNGTPCWHRTSSAGPTRHEKELVKVAHLTTGCDYGALANRYWDTSWFITLSTTAHRLFLSWTRWIQSSSPMLFIY